MQHIKTDSITIVDFDWTNTLIRADLVLEKDILLFDTMHDIKNNDFDNAIAFSREVNNIYSEANRTP